MTKTEYIYEVHSDVNENNIYTEFGNEQEAIDYAKNNIADETYVEKVEVVVDENGNIIDETGRIFIWSYKDELNEEVKPVEVDLEIDESADSAVSSDDKDEQEIEEDVDPDMVVKIEYPEGKKPEINIVDEIADDEQFSDDEIVIKDLGIEDEEAEDKVKVEISTSEDPDTAEMAVEPADFDEMIRFLVRELEEREEAIKASEAAEETIEEPVVEEGNEFDLEFNDEVNESLTLTESSLNIDSYKISDSEDISYGWDKHDGYYVRKTYQIPGELYSREDYYETYATEKDAKRAFDRLVAKYLK